jgi:hypothetical protein
MLGVGLASVPLGMGEQWRFYGQTAICLPLPITRRHFPGQHYAFGVFVVLNLVLFLLIGVGQIAVYQAIHSTSSSLPTLDGAGSVFFSSSPPSLQVKLSITLNNTRVCMLWFV